MLLKKNSIKIKQFSTITEEYCSINFGKKSPELDFDSIPNPNQNKRELKDVSLNNISLRYENSKENILNKENSLKLIKKNLENKKIQNFLDLNSNISNYELNDSEIPNNSNIVLENFKETYYNNKKNLNSSKTNSNGKYIDDNYNKTSKNLNISTNKPKQDNHEDLFDKVLDTIKYKHKKRLKTNNSYEKENELFSNLGKTSQNSNDCSTAKSTLLFKIENQKNSSVGKNIALDLNQYATNILLSPSNKTNSFNNYLKDKKFKDILNEDLTPQFEEKKIPSQKNFSETNSFRYGSSDADNFKQNDLKIITFNKEKSKDFKISQKNAKGINKFRGISTSKENQMLLKSSLENKSNYNYNLSEKKENQYNNKKKFDYNSKNFENIRYQDRAYILSPKMGSNL